MPRHVFIHPRPFAKRTAQLGLDWSEIDFTDQVIRVRYQMSRKGERVPVKTDAGRRDVILMDELARDLRKRRLAAPFSQDQALVLGDGLGNTLGYTRLLRAFSDGADAAELRGVTPHTCRHTFASILIDQGATASSSPISSDTRRPRPRGTSMSTSSAGVSTPRLPDKN